MPDSTNKKAAAATDGPVLRVRRIKSGIARPKDQKATLAGLGLTRMNRVRTLQDTPAVRGMIAKVAHLVELVDEDGAPLKEAG